MKSAVMSVDVCQNFNITILNILIFPHCAVALYLYLVGQKGEDLLGGGAEDAPAVVGGVWQGHGLSEALQQGAAQGQTLGTKVLLELL